MVRWNLESLDNLINRLDIERDNLGMQYNQMRDFQNRVDLNWQSPGGRIYQNRLQEDMAALGNIISQLERRVISLRKVQGYYRSAESQVRIAVNRLP